MLSPIVALTVMSTPTQLNPQLKIVDAGLGTKLKAQLAKVIQETGVPAMAAAVVVDGQVKAIAFHGKRRAGKAASVAGNDLWQLGSITKVFTKEVIRKAVNEKRIAWETTLARAFPNYVGTMHDKVKSLTIKQVADHTSGFANTHEGKPELFPPNMTLMQTRQKHVELAMGIEPPAAPGPYAYSNFGYCLLGALSEKIYGLPYESVLKLKILMPAGITNVFFGEPGLISPNQPWPHTFKDGKATPVSSCKNSLDYNVYAPAGHLSVSAVDAPKLLLGYMNGGGPSRGHDGSNGRNYARISMDTPKKYGYLIMTNCGGGGGKAALTAVQDWIAINIPKP